MSALNALSVLPTINASAFHELLIKATPLLDVRAPVEFARGAIPNSDNLPLLDDTERKQVGICYKHSGQQMAINLGHQLVGGELRQARISAWQHWLTRNERGAIYCFRGGLRSSIVQQWLHACGHQVPRILGGYKALHQFLCQQLDELAGAMQFVLISGRTGVGKTALLAQVPCSLDLEQIAHHRGSAFGRRLSAQPTPANFQHALALRLMHMRAAGKGPVWVEDESRNIGRLSLPPTLHKQMLQAPVVLLEADLDARVHLTLQSYVCDTLDEYQAHLGEEQGFSAFALYLREALDKIRKRLGGQRHARIRQQMDDALISQQSCGNPAAHCRWIEALSTRVLRPHVRLSVAQKATADHFSGPIRGGAVLVSRAPRTTGTRPAEALVRLLPER